MKYRGVKCYTCWVKCCYYYGGVFIIHKLWFIIYTFWFIIMIGFFHGDIYRLPMQYIQIYSNNRNKYVDFLCLKQIWSLSSFICCYIEQVELDKNIVPFICQSLQYLFLQRFISHLNWRYNDSKNILHSFVFHLYCNLYRQEIGNWMFLFISNLRKWKLPLYFQA